MRISDWSSDVCSSDLAYRRADAADHQPDAEKPDGMDPQATAEPRRAGTDHVNDTRHNHAIDLATESEAMASRNARPTRETQWLSIAVVIAAGSIAENGSELVRARGWSVQANTMTGVVCKTK